MSATLQAPWAKPLSAVLSFYKSDPKNGLSESQVKEHREKYGANETPPEERTPFWKLVLEQFEDKLVRILLGAAIISFGLAWFEGEEDRVTAFVEPLVIFLILAANATVGVLQEQKAEAAIEALKAYEADNAVVIRDGVIKQIPTAELVCGDLVEVAVGVQVPADLRLLELVSVTFRIDQSLLTGESVSVVKEVAPIAELQPSIQDKTNVLFKGTHVAIGKARGIVVGTGDSTELGAIRKLLSEKEEEASPLQKKLDDFGDLLSKVITVICVVVWVINIGHFSDPEHGNILKGAIYYFNIAVALAVAAIPEGLPAVVTTCLALGSQRMSKRNAIVRNLPSVETLGCTTVICSDKTGTLTTNKMSITKVLYVENANSLAELDVQGNSYAPVGDISVRGAKIEKPWTVPALQQLAVIGSLCNEGSITYAKGTYDRVGEPTEVAIKVLAEKIGTDQSVAGFSPEALALAHNKVHERNHRKEATLEFSRDRKSMSVLVNNLKTNKYSFLVKGAPENVLARSTHVFISSTQQVVPLTDVLRAKITAQTLTLSEQALRCIGLARIDDAKPRSSYDFNRPEDFAKVESNMTFVGVVGMFDPPREEVAPAVALCRTAGIRVIVITGDNKVTAESICRRIGIFGADEDLKGKSYTGREFDDLTPAEKAKAVQRASLFSRTEPAHKSALVRLLRDQGEVVAMTGDGVNDAPALKMADIGIAMGSGTAVAKGASQMVLADDNFATIVGAVEEGRSIYNNTKQFIRYLISSNIGEVVCIFLTAALGMPEALVPVQLLWVNLVTDGLPATALGFNPAEADIMKRKPRGQGDPIINGWMFFRYLVIGMYVGFATVAGFGYWFMYYSGGPQLSWNQLISHHKCLGTIAGTSHACDLYKHDIPATISLSILVTIEMFNALNSVSENQSIFTMPPFVNPLLIGAVLLSFALHFMILYVPFLASVFGVQPLSWGEWQIVLGFSAPVLLIDEVLKLISRVTSPRDASRQKKSQ
jgi:Ca2+ transporting ATPase